MSDLGSYVEMGSYVVIDEESVGVSLEWSFEGMVDGHCWVMFGVVGYCWVRFGVVGRGWVMSGVVGCCLVMCGVVGHSEEEVAVAVECWVEEEEVVVVD